MHLLATGDAVPTVCISLSVAAAVWVSLSSELSGTRRGTGRHRRRTARAPDRVRCRHWDALGLAHRLARDRKFSVSALVCFSRGSRSETSCAVMNRIRCTIKAGQPWCDSHAIALRSAKQQTRQQEAGLAEGWVVSPQLPASGLLRPQLAQHLRGLVQRWLGGPDHASR